jgi:hypothetical protein
MLLSLLLYHTTLLGMLAIVTIHFQWLLKIMAHVRVDLDTQNDCVLFYYTPWGLHRDLMQSNLYDLYSVSTETHFNIWFNS